MPKKSIIYILFTLLFTISATCAVDYEEIKALDLSASGLDQLSADVGAGFLKIRGVEGLDRIEVEAEFIIKKASDAKARDFIRDKLVFSLEKKGTKAVLTAKQKSLRGIFNSINYVINLTVKVPRTFNLRIDDGSGSMTVEEIGGNVWIDDGSGEILLRNIDGSVEMDDGSGDVELHSIGGDITIDDGSGTVEIIGSQGSVEVDDGSGSIHIRDCRGDVTIYDGSGSITISGIERDVHIKSDGSGSVNISDVRGEVYKRK